MSRKTRTAAGVALVSMALTLSACSQNFYVPDPGKTSSIIVPESAIKISTSQPELDSFFMISVIGFDDKKLIL